MSCCTKTCSFGALLGRICIGAIFLLAGVGKFMNYDGTAAYMASKGMTLIPFFLVVGAVIEVIGGLSLILGFMTRWGALLLLLFMIPTTAIFHDFWNLQEPERQAMLTAFLKNLGIFGGLLYVAVYGAGRLSVDAFRCCENGSCNKP